ncbi:MAG: FAD-dependent oxidoreductase [Thermodesulfobacteriota bacterium]
MMKTDVAIIGGGIAGLWCAYELSRLGFRSVIVERNAHLGGHVAYYCCKATDKCQRCGACLLEDVLDTIQSSDKISFHLQTNILRVERANGRFSLKLLRRPSRIHPDQCNDCGKCLDTCPSPGALARTATGDRLLINEEACLFFRDRSCRVCVDVCPEGAVNLAASNEEISLDASSVILATGFKPFDAGEKPRFGYGRVPGVITGLELDQMLRADNFDVGNGEKALRSVAFIQCIGSRDPRIGRNYCSRVCCGYALRLARLLRSRSPEIEPSMFYMDIQTFDRDFERRLDIARKEVRLIRAIPAEVRSGSEGRPELIYHGPNDEKLYESFDLVVLSIGISPNPAIAGLAELLEVPLNEDAFLGVNGDEVMTGTSGVFVAGAAQGPKSIEESVSHAIKTAANVASYLNRSGQGDKS